MAAFTKEDLDCSLYSDLHKWPFGLLIEEIGFQKLSVSSSDGKNSYMLRHDYGKVLSCSCKNHVDGHRFCKHMAVGQYVVDRRKERVTPKPKQAEVVLSESKADKAALNGSRAFSLL